jgi:hypothetical protein
MAVLSHGFYIGMNREVSKYFSSLYMRSDAFLIITMLLGTLSRGSTFKIRQLRHIDHYLLNSACCSISPCIS